MADLEDGELPSDDEDGAINTAEQVTVPAFKCGGTADVLSAPPIPAEPFPISRHAAVPGLSSDDSSDDSDDSSCGWKSQSKKKRVEGMDTGIPQEGGSWVSAPARRVNNVWSTVLQEQTLSHTMVGLGVDKLEAGLQMDRDVENYDFTLAKTDTRPHVARLVQPESHDPFDKLIDHEQFGDTSRRGTKRRWTRKHNRDTHGRAEDKEDTPSVPLDLTEEENKIVCNIVTELDEPNVQLFGRIVKVLGEEKCASLMEATRAKEADGGILTFNGDRRRTPGGVFIYLLKQDPDIERDKWGEIFIDDYKKNALNRTKRRRTRRKRQRKPVDLADEIKECLRRKTEELESKMEQATELEMESTEVNTEVNGDSVDKASNGELKNQTVDVKVESSGQMEHSEQSSDFTHNGADLHLDIKTEPILF